MELARGGPENLEDERTKSGFIAHDCMTERAVPGVQQI